jgi:hypothetical protein
MQRPQGCLGVPLLPIYGVSLLISGVTGGVRQITAGPTLPNVRWDLLHDEDKPAIRRARASAEGCLHALNVGRRELGRASEDVAREVIKLFTRICAVAEELARARKFVRDNDPDQIARQRAEVEVKALGASFADRAANEATLKAMEDRGKHAVAVQGDVGVMNARLIAAVVALETLNTRLARESLSKEERSARVHGVLDDLKAQHDEAERALQAYAATAREIAKLGG